MKNFDLPFERVKLLVLKIVRALAKCRQKLKIFHAINSSLFHLGRPCIKVLDNDLLELSRPDAEIGGWRAEVESGKVTWSPGTALIHGQPVGYSPKSIEEAFGFYAPEYRNKIQEAFDSCIRTGELVDIVCQLNLINGSAPWVRVIGVSERNQKGQVEVIKGTLQDITKLHQAQTRADLAEQQRLDVLDNISDAVIALDEQWNFTYTNQYSLVLLDRVGESLIGKDVWKEFPDAVGSQFEDEYKDAMKNRSSKKFEAFYAPLDKWFNISVYPIPEGIAIYFQDITQIREDQEYMRLADAALSMQNDIVIITSTEGMNDGQGPRIVFVNNAFEEQTGYSKSEAIGNTPTILHGPSSDIQQLRRIKAALQKKQSIRCELLNYTKSQSTFWVELEITPLFNKKGDCTHFIGVERDVTVRKHYEAELKIAKERFELISKATNDVVWDWNLVSDNLWWSEGIEYLFGHEVSGKASSVSRWIKYIHPDDREDIINDLYAVIDSSENSWLGEYRFIKNDGQYASIIDRGFVIRDESGKAVRMVGSMLDITERKEMEDKLRESQKIEAIGHLTGGVAHDFNNLLTVILGSAEILANSIKDEELRYLAEATLSAAKTGGKLTNRLLAFARRQPLNPKVTDINELVDTMLVIIRRTLTENIELVFEPQSLLWPIEVDAGELHTALINLIINSRDAMPNGGELTIETMNIGYEEVARRIKDVVPSDYTMLSVKDNGSGISPSSLTHVFEPFFTTKPIGEGSGLGLSMVFGFTKQSGGYILIDSEFGQGTIIKLYFPRVYEKQQRNKPTSSKTLPTQGDEHILLVEDNRLVLKHLENVLVSLGYQVSTATSGTEAIAILNQRNDIALLLTDIVMPGGLNGREVAEKALMILPELKVLFTSGYSENALVHHGRLDKEVSLISKPYTRSELANKVRYVLLGENATGSE